MGIAGITINTSMLTTLVRVHGIFKPNVRAFNLVDDRLCMGFEVFSRDFLLHFGKCQIRMPGSPVFCKRVIRIDLGSSAFHTIFLT
jgi:hypothetical protein